MRFAGLAHNTGLYVPELYPDLELAAVPADDRAAIEAALADRPRRESDLTTELVEVTSAEVDRDWVGAPFGDGLYRGGLELVSEPRAFYAGAQTTVDVRVTNRSDRVWRWGVDARPAIRLVYSWRRGDRVAVDDAALCTALPVDIPPGASEIVPVHVVPPLEPGRYELELDLVHEGVRRFGVTLLLEPEVRPRRRLAVIAPAERIGELALELELPPDVEVVAVLRDPADCDAYGDFATVAGLRPYLLAGADDRGRLRTLAGVLYRTAAAARAGHGWARPEYQSLLALRSGSDALVIDAPNWELDAAFGREWTSVAATALLWRLGGKPVFLRDEALPGGPGLRERAVRGVLRALRS